VTAVSTDMKLFRHLKSVWKFQEPILWISISAANVLEQIFTLKFWTNYNKKQQILVYRTLLLDNNFGFWGILKAKKVMIANLNLT
jgi:hypothetical protein